MHHALCGTQKFCCCAAVGAFVALGAPVQLCSPAELESVCKDPETHPGLWKTMLDILCSHCPLLDQCDFANEETAETGRTADGAFETTVVKKFPKDEIDMLFTVLFGAERLGMTTDCPHGVTALLMTLNALDPGFYEDTVSIQKIAGKREVVIRVSLMAAQGSTISFAFLTDATADLTPFPLSTKPILAWSSWQHLSLEPIEPKCNRASLPPDCAEDALGINWASFLLESCRSCDQYFCREPRHLLDLADQIVDQAWTERYSGEALPCAAGYITALLIKSKHNSFRYGAAGSIEAKYIQNDDDEKVFLHIEFRMIKNRLAVFHTLPFSSLSPFPLDLAVFHHSLSRATSVEQRGGTHFDVACNVAWHLHLAGVLSFLMPGDSSLQPLNETGLTGTSSTSRVTVFVPIEQRKKALAVMQGTPHTCIVESYGLVQIGPIPYEAAPPNLPFRVFCASCVYANVVFYATDSDWLFPLYLWRPCRIPMFAIFPLQRQEWGDRPVHVAHDAEMDPQRKTMYMQYEDDAPSLPSFSGASICRQQLLQVPEVQEMKTSDSAPWFPIVHPEFDISKEVNANMDPVDLKMVRQLSNRAGLVKFLDKIQLKEWARDRDIDIPHIYYMSNSSSEVPLELLKMPAFVAKPAHLADSSHIYVMRDGINLINGYKTSAEEVQAGLHAAFKITNLNDWATENASPGVIVEELVEPAISSDMSNSRGLYTTPDELKCHAAWGELLFCQWVWVAYMSTDLTKVTAKSDWPLNQGHFDFGIPEFTSEGYVFRDGSCVLCARAPPVDWKATVKMVETVATGSDYMRVDIFMKDGKPVLNEVTITFAAIHGWNPQLAAELSRRWLEGYEWLNSR